MSFILRRFFRIRILLLFPLLINLAGCAQAPVKGWGSEVSVSPGWAKFKRAAINAAKDPGTWVPAAGAALVMLSGRDEFLTQEAIEENWVYGSMEDAGDTSDEHALLLDKLWLASMLVTSNGEEKWVRNKAKGVLAEALIVNTSILTTNVLKKAVRRREPYEGLDHVEYEAFPSNHSTPQFTQAALIRRNLRYTSVNDFSKYSFITASYLLASSSAYGRVESGLHHFSDQLAGAALGNFIGLVLFDTFVEDESQWSMALYPTEDYSGALAQFTYSY